MEKMDIKVDDLLEGTMNKILEAGDTASFERARCTVNLLGETVSVYAKVTDCDSGDYCGDSCLYDRRHILSSVSCHERP